MERQMAEQEENIAPLPAPPTGNLVPPEKGYNGLQAVAGQVYEECNPELAWPRCTQTFKAMLKDSTVSAGVEYPSMEMRRYYWDVEAPKGKEKQLDSYIKILRTMMSDMEHPWEDFINEAFTFVSMGFAVHEIVPRYRLKSKGSRFNDGYVGIRKLAFRSQDSIVGWNWRNQGRDLDSFVQEINIPRNYNEFGLDDYTSTDSRGNTTKVIPLSNCLLFRNNPKKNSPTGSSPLVNCWESWKYKKAYEKVESSGVQADVHGFKILYIPDQYMREDASEGDKAIYKYYQDMMANAHIGKQSGFILPNIVNPYGGGKEGLFKFEIVNSQGNKAYDIGKIISRYTKEILTSLYADFLVVGQDGAGSMALSESKKEVLKMVVETKLGHIQNVLNHTLIPFIFKENNWETEVLPRFVFKLKKEEKLLDYSTAMYRFLTAGAIPIVPETINEILEKAGSDYRVEESMSTEELRKILSGKQQTSGGGSVSDDPSGSDNSATNANNV